MRGVRPSKRWTIIVLGLFVVVVVSAYLLWFS
jgi:hypothetical protein